MRKLKPLLLIVAMAILPATASAIVYVNDRAPGVHQTTEFGTGEKIWVNSMGDKIANVKDAKTMADFDKDDIAYEGTHGNSGNVIIDPVKNGIKKVWDNYRKCYIWQNKEGSYLGRVPSELQQKEWEKAQKDPKDGWEKSLNLTQAAIDALNDNTNNGWGTSFSKYSDLFNKKEQPANPSIPQFTQKENDNVDCTKELNEILNDPHMNVSLAKERLDEGGLNAKQQKALEKYISMGGKKQGNESNKKEAEKYLKDADANIAQLEKQLAEIRKARAQLKSLGGYGAAYEGDLDKAEAQIKAAIQKYKSMRQK